jgi:hypothetical protein
MSKVDAQRAMREARYAAFQASREAPTAPPPPPAKARSARPQAAGPVPAAADTPVDVEAGGPAEPGTVGETETETVIDLTAGAEPEAAVAVQDAGTAGTAGTAQPALQSSAPDGEPEPEDATAGLCGHRNMGNKSCSRPAGHPEKNHRYR